MGPRRVEPFSWGYRVTHADLLVVLTPTYGPDLELCRDLNDSITRLGTNVRHRIIASSADLSRIHDLGRGTTELQPREHLVPRYLIPAPRNMRVDVRRPWWPVRGWITQQIVKLEATASSTADLVLVVDSDLVFIRPFGKSAFLGADGPTLFRLPGAVHAGMPRHVEWHRVARVLLGLDPLPGLPLPDYVCWPCPWEPTVVRRMLGHIEDVHGRPWQRLVAAQRHFSEMVLYGVYVDEILSRSQVRSTTARMKCLLHHDERPLDEAGIKALLARAAPDDVAVMISAKSGTDLAVRRRVLTRASE
jgi:hypothetical protein